jgi:hypothetical protein
MGSPAVPQVLRGVSAALAHLPVLFGTKGLGLQTWAQKIVKGTVT